MEENGNKNIKSTLGENGKEKSAKMDTEVAKLRAENACLKAEREILKKALGLPYNFSSRNVFLAF
ncbi:hypothetical protein DSL64_03900 [Dyadobacter luteus]|uniref:Uncharacterized protein n=1 Tax=Dyadobacter luteus TaxID=2259619 RepID=A0A3D8YGU8_9BACT|nr:hypothetical protein [Dyadobacter luteus]REA63596.1 hypothetical protein DSL64_03900 [Dyadobacter luteus]